MGERGPVSSVDQDKALCLRLQGHTFAEIAVVLGVSRQRIQQILSPPRKVRDRVVIAAAGECAACGLFVGSAGHVHHRQAGGLSRENYNDYPNLVLLCASCHRTAHKETPPISEQPAPIVVISGPELKARREALGLDQAGLAARLGVHMRTISKWERGVHAVPEMAALALQVLEQPSAPKRRRAPHQEES